MTVTKRDSNFEWLRIISMLMIVAHHYVAKNIFNVDIEVVGLSWNKLFIQFIGNYAFVGNNLFFMISAYYLCDLDGTFHLKKIGKKVWKLEKQMLFYSIGLYIIFSIFYGGGYFQLLIESLFPLSTSLWWYPTTYVVFLFVQPFYQKGLLSMDQVDIRKLIVVMTVIWSFTTIIPFFDYGSSNFLTFIMLYAITFYLKKYGIRVLRSKKNCIKLVVLGCLIGFFSIVCMDAVGIWIPEVGKYACYFMRGNFRPLPLLISVGFFAWSTQWKLRGEKLVNNIAKLTFGVYLIHMYPPMKEMLFTKIFNIEMIVERRDMPILAMGTIIVVFVGCCVLELIRRNTFDLIIQKVEEKILSKFNCFASYRL